MIPENYDDTIRPALARFCGWQLVKSHGYNYRTMQPVSEMWTIPDDMDTDYQAEPPDPLRNPASAWGLQCAILENVHDVMMEKTCAGYACDLFQVETSKQPSPELALVLAAWAVVQALGERGTK